MRHLSLVLGFACPPAGSPLIHPPHLLPCSTLSSSRSHRHRQPCHLDASRHAELGPSMGSALTRPATTRSRAFLSNEAVSYYHNPDTGSEIWLVGVIHDARASSRVRTHSLNAEFWVRQTTPVLIAYCCIIVQECLSCRLISSISSRF